MSHASQGEPLAPPAGAEPAVRVECPHAAACGGCPLIDLPYPEQLVHKRDALLRAVARHAVLAGTELAALLAASPVTGYRTRAKLVIAPGPRIGLYAGPDHVVTDIPECRVLDPALARATAALRELCRAHPPAAGSALEPYGKRGRGALLGVDLRAVAAERPGVLATLIVARERAPGRKVARAAAEALMAADPEILGVSVSHRAVHAPRLLGDAPEHVAGAESLPDRIGAVELRATPGAFVQAHRGQAARLAALVAERVGALLGGLEEPRVLELFAGSGALGLAVARACPRARVTLVESLPSAAEAAREAALRTAPERVTVRAAEASAALPELAAGAPPLAAVLVDPPRRGLGPELRAALAGAAPRALAYVSCDVETLARDLAAFRWLGYASPRLEPLDMIPLSAEVETFALLVPAPAPAPRVLHDGGGLLAVDKPPHLPTTPQGEHARSLLDAVRKLPGGAAAVPLHRLDIGTSGVCLFARSAQVAGALARAFTEGRAQKTYLALVRGMTQPRGSIRRPLEDEGRMREASTRYRRVAVVAGHSLLEVEPAEGRRHQIRRHLASIGHPVVGDARWGDAATNRHFEARYGLDRTFLHCRRIELAPGAGEPGPSLVLESELAGDLAAVEARAGGAG